MSYLKPKVVPANVVDVFTTEELDDPMPEDESSDESTDLSTDSEEDEDALSLSSRLRRSLRNRRSLKKKRIWEGEPGEYKAVEDMLQLEELTEESVLMNIRVRYRANLFYTYIGSILVAVNPYKAFDIYSEKQVKLYDGQIIGSRPPHLFGIGNAAFTSMLENKENQCLIISGESGAGKTESTKILVEYLAAVNTSRSSLIAEQLLEASPLLESFGNAKTIRNNNSSRFGKYMEVFFRSGCIIGGRSSQYLLERSRITHQNSRERNFHIFYELLAGASPEDKERLSLGATHEYNYLNKVDDPSIAGKSDREDFRKAISAMNVLQFSRDEQNNVIEILASVLHLGNIRFIMEENRDKVVVRSKERVSILSYTLKLDAVGITDALTHKTMEARRERMRTPLTISQAEDTRDAIAKALYSHLFTWLVSKINRIIMTTEPLHQSIALLDIFGFESLPTNSFEQLCINYANEQLHNLFNQRVFSLEQEVYEKEGINWQYMNFPDNKDAIELIGKRPLGIIYLLDDECQFPKGADATFLSKLHQAHSSHARYSRTTIESMKFTIMHYAGPIQYDATKFTSKNKDALRCDVVELLRKSGNKIVASVFAKEKDKDSIRQLNKITGRITTMKPRTPTVAASFQESLGELLEKISKCQSWFVKCIKPNSRKQAMHFDTDTVNQQLCYSGVLDIVKIRQQGYPRRISYEEFPVRFVKLIDAEVSKAGTAQEVCVRILRDVFHAQENIHYQLGHTKLFLKESFSHEIESQRLEIILKAVTVIQTKVKGFMLRRRFLKLKAAAIKVQSNWRAYNYRHDYRRFKMLITKCQATVRKILQRRYYLKHKEALIEERDQRWENAKRMKEITKKEMLAIASLDIPTELAFLYHMTQEWNALHTERNIESVISKIYTQNYGLTLPKDVNNYPFNGYSSANFQNHFFLPRKDPVDHPFLIKIKETDYKDSIAMFKLVLRYMFDVNISDKKQVLLGNYIIQKALSSRALRDELYAQLCVQMWYKKGELSSEKIAQLMAMCLSVFPPSPELYKFLLKYVSDHAYDGYKAFCQHRLLRCWSVELPVPRNYPPCLIEWQACREQAKMALKVRLPSSKDIICQVDSWTTGEECGRLALAACGLTDNRHGWTVQMHDEETIYELGGHDNVFDLLGEIEVPPGLPHNVAPFLVSSCLSCDTKKVTKPSRGIPHRPDVDRNLVFEISSDYSRSFSSTRSTSTKNEETLTKYTPLLKPTFPNKPHPLIQSFPPPPGLTEIMQNGVIPPAPPLDVTSFPKLQPTKSALKNQKKPSALNERPAEVDVPGLSKKSVMNRRYLNDSKEPASSGVDRDGHIPDGQDASNGDVIHPIEASVIVKSPNRKKPSSVTFSDQTTANSIYALSQSGMNERYFNGMSTTKPLAAMSSASSLNHRYVEGSVSDNASVVQRNKTLGLILETPRNAPPSLVASYSNTQNLLPSKNEAHSSIPVKPLPSAPTKEPSKIHQDIMQEINKEILGFPLKSTKQIHSDNERESTKSGQSTKHLVKRKHIVKLTKDKPTTPHHAVNRSVGKSEGLSNISDLDEWVDKVFDPIIQDSSISDLTSPNLIKKSLKGNGLYNQDNSDDLCQNWLSDVLSFSGGNDLSSLTDANRLSVGIKGIGDDVQVEQPILADANNNPAGVMNGSSAYSSNQSVNQAQFLTPSQYRMITTQSNHQPFYLQHLPYSYIHASTNLAHPHSHHSTVASQSQYIPANLLSDTVPTRENLSALSTYPLAETHALQGSIQQHQPTAYNSVPIPTANVGNNPNSIHSLPALGNSQSSNSVPSYSLNYTQPSLHQSSQPAQQNVYTSEVSTTAAHTFPSTNPAVHQSQMYSQHQLLHQHVQQNHHQKQPVQHQHSIQQQHLMQQQQAVLQPIQQLLRQPLQGPVQHSEAQNTHNHTKQVLQQHVQSPTQQSPTQCVPHMQHVWQQAAQRVVLQPVQRISHHTEPVQNHTQESAQLPHIHSTQQQSFHNSLHHSTTSEYSSPMIAEIKGNAIVSDQSSVAVSAYSKNASQYKNTPRKTAWKKSNTEVAFNPATLPQSDGFVRTQSETALGVIKVENESKTQSQISSVRNLASRYLSEVARVNRINKVDPKVPIKPPMPRSLSSKNIADSRQCSEETQWGDSESSDTAPWLKAKRAVLRKVEQNKKIASVRKSAWRKVKKRILAQTRETKHYKNIEEQRKANKQLGIHFIQRNVRGSTSSPEPQITENKQLSNIDAETKHSSEVTTKSANWGNARNVLLKRVRDYRNTRNMQNQHNFGIQPDVQLANIRQHVSTQDTPLSSSAVPTHPPSSSLPVNACPNPPMSSYPENDHAVETSSGASIVQKLEVNKLQAELESRKLQNQLLQQSLQNELLKQQLADLQRSPSTDQPESSERAAEQQSGSSGSSHIASRNAVRSSLKAARKFNRGPVSMGPVSMGTAVPTYASFKPKLTRSDAVAYEKGEWVAWPKTASAVDSSAADTECFYNDLAVASEPGSVSVEVADTEHISPTGTRTDLNFSVHPVPKTPQKAAPVRADSLPSERTETSTKNTSVFTRSKSASSVISDGKEKAVRVGKVRWPPVKEEEVKQEKEPPKPPPKPALKPASAATKKKLLRIGKLLIEEAHAEKIKNSVTGLTEDQLQAVKELANRTAIVTKKPVAQSLSERLQNLESKIGAKAESSSEPNIVSVSSPDLVSPFPLPQLSASIEAASSHTIVEASYVSKTDASVETVATKQTPIVSKVDFITQADTPKLAQRPLALNIKTETTQTTDSLRRVLGADSSPNVTDMLTIAANISVVPSTNIDSIVLSDTSSEDLEVKTPPVSLTKQMELVRTALLPDTGPLKFLTYTDVPWILSIRKEVFSPEECLPNKMTQNLVFYQIVKDVLVNPCVRVPSKERDVMKRILGKINAQNMTDPNIPQDLKWRVITKARSWPFYFARIYPVMENRERSNVQFLAVSHSGLRFGKRIVEGDRDELVCIYHILFEDITHVRVPKEDVFVVIAEHKTYKVYTNRAAQIANIVNAYGIEAKEGGTHILALKDHITSEPGILSFKKGDMIKLKPDSITPEGATAHIPVRGGWVYGSFNGKMGMLPEDSFKTLSKKDIHRSGSFQDSRSRHSSGRSEGEPIQTSTGKFSMLEFSMMYFRENIDRYVAVQGQEGGMQGSIKAMENLKLNALKRKKSFRSSKDSDKSSKTESWSWKEQADMIKWTKTPIQQSLLKLPSQQVSKAAAEVFMCVMQFMGDQPLNSNQTDIDCAFKILKYCHQHIELRDEVYCQLAKQTTSNKSPSQQSCLRGWRLFTLLCCWFGCSDILKPFLVNYLQQNASDPSRAYHQPASVCLQTLRKTLKYGGRRNIPSADEISAITDGRLTKRQIVLLPGGVPFVLNITANTVIQDVITEICSKIDVVSQMEMDEYTVFSYVESDNEYSRLKREEYVMDIITEMKLHKRDCALMFERTSWYFPLKLEGSFDFVSLAYSQCVPDYIDGWLLTFDHHNSIPARQLDDIIRVAALMYKAAGNDQQPTMKDIEVVLPGPLLSLGIMKPSQFLNGIIQKFEELSPYTDHDCKVEVLDILSKWPLFGASFFNINCVSEPRISGDCVLAINRAGVHFLKHKTRKVILSYPFTEVISSRKITSSGSDQFLDIKVGNNRVQKIVRIETDQGADVSHLIGQYIRAVNNSATRS